MFKFLWKLIKWSLVIIVVIIVALFALSFLIPTDPIAEAKRTQARIENCQTLIWGVGSCDENGYETQESKDQTALIEKKLKAEADAKIAAEKAEQAIAQAKQAIVQAKLKARAERVANENNRKFETWVIQNTAVTVIEFPMPGSIFVRLQPSKYTSKSNVESIAKKIARYYKLQTGYSGLTSVSVFSFSGSDIYAKGRN